VKPDSPLLYIVVGGGTVLLTAVSRWVWIAIRDKFREWVREPVKEAREAANHAAEHAENVQNAIGTPNGAGDLLTMASRVLANQSRQFDWQREHDTKDDAMAVLVRQTRSDVIALQSAVAELRGQVSALVMTRPPFADGEQTGTG
jgi:hypothetical protein